VAQTEQGKQNGMVSVRLSVPAWATAANFAAGRRYRSTAARRTAARRYSATATLSAYVVADHRFVTSCVQNTLSNNNLAMFFHKTYDCQSKSACHSKKGKGNPYSITERRVPKLIPVLCSQPAGDVSHKAGGRLPLVSPRPELPSQPLRGQLPTSLLGEQRHDGCEQFA